MQKITDSEVQAADNPVSFPFDTAKWICGNYAVNPGKRYPVDCFRKTFTVKSLVLKSADSDTSSATLMITACGLYEAKINGVRVGDFVLAPGITDYRKRVHYQVYDVASLLHEGENTLEVMLADGWYRGSCGAWGVRNQYGTRTKLLAELTWKDQAGHAAFVSTDKTWDWSNDGPIRFADNKDGEIYDARLTPSYGGKACECRHNVIPCLSPNRPIREREHFSASVITTPSGKTVLDFGQNIAGYVAFSAIAHEGQRLKLRFGEFIDKTGEFSQKNIQCATKNRVTPLQQVDYIACEGENSYKTRFAIFGFRYVLVEGDLPVIPEDFTAIAVYSDLTETGTFTCSNELINQFFLNTIWSAKGNFCDLPTDCPTRERHGWSGDAQIFASTACYIFDFYPFALKYLNDLYDWQRPDGCLPQIAPEGGTDFYMRSMNGSVGWADAGIIIPYTLWKHYGDTSVLTQYLDGMEKYAAFQIRRLGKWYPTAKCTGLHGQNRRYLNNAGQAYGEWAEPDEVHHMTWKDCAVPHPEVATAYTAHILDLMNEIEASLGRAQKAAYYADIAQKCRTSYQALMRTPAYSLNTDRQARLVRPLAFHMLSPEQEAYARKRLIEALDHFGWRLGTGFLSTPLILDVLTEIDPAYAYRLLENEEMPGWLFMPKKGATTVWEAWEGTESPNGGIASLNHYSKGAVCRYLFDTVCGIRPEGPNRFVIAPVPGGTLSFARATYDSWYGKVESGWEKKDGRIVYTVSIPAGCTAQVKLPDGREFVQEAGEKQYK